MKKIFTFLSVLLFASSVLAGGAPSSFNITNYIVSGQSLTTYPTNSGTAAGVPQATGNAVETFNQRTLGFNFQGSQVVTGSTAVVGFKLVTSMAGNHPAGYSDWQNNGTFNWLTVTVTVGTNTINNQQLIQNSSLLSEANYVGVAGITNNFATGDYVTNCVLTVNKKILPFIVLGQ